MPNFDSKMFGQSLYIVAFDSQTLKIVHKFKFASVYVTGGIADVGKYEPCHRKSVLAYLPELDSNQFVLLWRLS